VAFEAEDQKASEDEVVLCLRRMQAGRMTSPNGTQYRYPLMDFKGGRTKMVVREVQKSWTAVGSDSSNALLDADTLRGSL